MKFSIVIIPDTQVTIQDWPEDGYKAADWIKANTTRLNIAAVVGVGDITEWPRWADWLRGVEMYSRMGDVVKAPVDGNHDFDHWSDQTDQVLQGRGDRSLSNYHKAFPVSSLRNVVAAYPEGQSGNMAQTFEAAGIKFLIVSLNYIPQPAELQFLERTIAAYPDRKVIINTHDYMNHTDRSPSGDRIWAIIRRYPNVVMTMNGHYYPTAGHRVDAADDGHDIYQFMIDYQNYNNREPNSYIQILTFDTSELSITGQTFSPAFEKHMTGEDNEFELFGAQFLADAVEEPPVSRPTAEETQRVANRLIAFFQKWYPFASEMYVTSSYRPFEDDGGTWSYHNGQFYQNSPAAAVDFAAPMTDAGQRRMQHYSRWRVETFGDLIPEFLHSTPFADDRGFHVKDRVVDTGDFYDAPHVNHCHDTTSDALMDLCEARAVEKWGSSPPVPTPTPPPAPVRSSTFGWDASNHDWNRGPVDVLAAKNDGIQFFVHKVGGIGPSEGGNYEDPFFSQALARAKDAQVPVLGSYFVVCPSRYASASEQVDYWVKLLDKNFSEWRSVPMIHQIDAEKWGQSDYPASADDIRAIVAEWRARSLPGYLVGYLPDEFYKSSGDLGVDLWLPDYHTNGSSYRDLYPGDDDLSWNTVSAGRKPRILQYASDARIGSQPSCDANAFNGTIEELTALTGSVLPNPPPTPEDDGVKLSDVVPSATTPDVPNRNLDQVLGDLWKDVHWLLPEVIDDVAMIGARLDQIQATPAAPKSEAVPPVSIASAPAKASWFNPNKYAKAIVASLGAAFTAYQAYKTGGMTAGEWQQVLAAGIGMFGLTWAVPNKADKDV